MDYPGLIRASVLGLAISLLSTASYQVRAAGLQEINPPPAGAYCRHIFLLLEFARSAVGGGVRVPGDDITSTTRVPPLTADHVVSSVDRRIQQSIPACG